MSSLIGWVHDDPCIGGTSSVISIKATSDNDIIPYICKYFLFKSHFKFCFTQKIWQQLCIQMLSFNTLRPRQNGRYFADDIFKCIFLNENAWISLNISLKFVPKVRIDNIPALVQIMAWRRSGTKPLSEPMMVSLLTHICITLPQCVNWIPQACWGFF